MIAQGWGDQSDAARLHDDPVLAIAANDRAGVGAAKDALASQATFSRCLDLLSQEKNRAVLETAPLELAARRLRAQGRKRLSRITLDIDGLPLSVHGEQPGSAYNGHVRERIHYPLIALLRRDRGSAGGPAARRQRGSGAAGGDLDPAHRDREVATMNSLVRFHRTPTPSHWVGEALPNFWKD